ncbi:lytic murein transglycosylase [Nocardioides sp. GCM10027113]|uniref:lytic murein transglycosylase n=1 Tax=unclassified Nocardioides TaxID=2615069 RepID=UPI00360C2FB7
MTGRVVGGLAIVLAVTVLVARWASLTVLAPDDGSRLTERHHVAAPTPPAVDPDVPPGEPLGPPEPDPAWVEETAAATDIPEPALRAYARAHLASDPTCVVGWTTLAGIGWVESQHGTIGGRDLDGDGRPSRRILGPALDGSGSFAAIPATPRSSGWHGDPHWEHAVGPMQFIPASWETWATDGDGDGTADPHDLDDAAAAARRYLCAGDPDLGTAADWERAVFSYNHATSYVEAVHDAATAYAAEAPR